MKTHVRVGALSVVHSSAKHSCSTWDIHPSLRKKNVLLPIRFCHGSTTSSTFCKTVWILQWGRQSGNERDAIRKRSYAACRYSEMKPISSIQAFQLVPDSLNLAYLLFRGAKKKNTRVNVMNFSCTWVMSWWSIMIHDEMIPVVCLFDGIRVQNLSYGGRVQNAIFCEGNSIHDSMWHHGSLPCWVWSKSYFNILMVPIARRWILVTS